MSEEKVEIVPRRDRNAPSRNVRRLTLGSRIPGRRVEDVVAIRAPRFYRTLAEALFLTCIRLPAGSRVRRAVILRVAQRSYDAVMRQDMEALLAMYHPELVWDTTQFRDWPESRIYRGREGLREFFDEWFAAMSDVRAEIRDMRDLGGRRTVLFVEMKATGRGSGVEVAFPWAQVGTVRDGLISEVLNFSNYSDALEAAGLRE
jgi:ketosteroid isomerase-like protein